MCEGRFSFFWTLAFFFLKKKTQIIDEIVIENPYQKRKLLLKKTKYLVLKIIPMHSFFKQEGTNTKRHTRK